MEHERAIHWNDEITGIEWLFNDLLLSAKNELASPPKEANYFN
jgi:dTDP-4-dehydrorhamnose 3,5-epimerase-like enzyme